MYLKVTFHYKNTLEVATGFLFYSLLIPEYDGNSLDCPVSFSCFSRVDYEINSKIGNQ